MLACVRACVCVCVCACVCACVDACLLVYMYLYICVDVCVVSVFYVSIFIMFEYILCEFGCLCLFWNYVHLFISGVVKCRHTMALPG